MPPAWVWLVFSLSMLILTASMLTWREGRRFSSRPLTPAEAEVVRAALDLAAQDGPTRSLQVLHQKMSQGKIRAMDAFTFARAEERNAFGYTDERGRILLNPNLCFAYQRSLSPRLRQGVECADLVATLATLQHEAAHLLKGASEVDAYEEEWRCVRRHLLPPKGQLNDQLTDEWREWEKHLLPRIRQHAGPAAALQIVQRLKTRP